MKKILTALMAFLMVFSLAACGAPAAMEAPTVLEAPEAPEVMEAMEITEVPEVSVAAEDSLYPDGTYVFCTTEWTKIFCMDTQTKSVEFYDYKGDEFRGSAYGTYEYVPGDELIKMHYDGGSYPLGDNYFDYRDGSIWGQTWEFIPIH